MTAARLARLTKEAAADQLARMIARLSDRRWNLSEAHRIAGGLIERLPIARFESRELCRLLQALQFRQIKFTVVFD